MRMTIVENVKPSMPKTSDAKEFMIQLKEYSQSDIADKSIVGSLMSELTTKKFEWSQPIHDHVTSMSNLAAKLKAMGMDVSESFLVQFIINSLPPEFGQFQVNYNTIKEKWNLQEIKAMLVQEEGRLRKLKGHSVHLTMHDGASSNKAIPGRKDRKKDKAPMKVHEGRIHKELRCHFCRKSGHFKKDCRNERHGLRRKGFLSIHPISGTEKFLFMGNIMKARIEGIGTYRLILDTGYFLDLENVFMFLNVQGTLFLYQDWIV
ncbi:hypothetical protein Syun_003991 [Stephania yunnanensis]|uniref:CCHC-type domain-containing protein n=1 Tax=Stephania yunnanensis TaxID=152371 RepID=A0AAP0Q245_9MAGN